MLAHYVTASGDNNILERAIPLAEVNLSYTQASLNS